MTAVADLRAATAPAHDAVDAAFGGFDLADRASYARFLAAHARALPAAEAWLAAQAGLPAFRPRTPALLADLAVLDVPVPAPLPFSPAADGAAGWGVLYVVEGSRLGGAMLARRVPETLPSAYLGARHLGGEWRALLQRFEAAAAAHDPAWAVAAQAAALDCFALYGRAAEADRVRP